MKKLIITALTLIFAVSCNVKELQADYIKAPIFYGQIESESFSKTGLSVDSDGVGTILWKPSDNINVFFGTKSVKYTSNNSEEAINVSFETKDAFTDIDAASNNNWGLYPYNSEAECDGLSVTTTIPNIQICADNTFGTDLFPMIAHTTSNDLHFLNICGGIKFSLSRDDIRSITFKGNNDEDIVGKVKVSINDDGKPETSIISGEKQITITPESGTTFKQNTNYYIVMPPVVLSNGFTMTFETETSVGTFIYKEKPVVIKRTIFSSKDQIDTYASFKLFDNVVDMGLSVLWASSNIGATKPEEYGDYYAWGEIETKTNYSWDTYKWCNGTSNTLIKYNYNSSKGTVDNNYSLDMDDDAAHIKLGGKWRIPTKDEFDELLKNCTYQWTTQNDVYGLIFTSNINGATLFFPSVGYIDGVTEYGQGQKSYARFWSSLLNAESAASANILICDPDKIYTGPGSRVLGHPIRPVYGNIIEATSISLDKTSLELVVGEIVQLTASLTPSNCTAKGLIWSSNNPSVATVSSSGQVTALSKGEAIITVIWIGDFNISVSCGVTVKNPHIGGHEYVDLGLPSGLKWASCNIGATKPEEYGDYYAWGETETKTEYASKNYKWYNGSSSIEKYNSNNDNLELEDDVAHIKYGDGWRMPTPEECKELVSNCTVQESKRNGVNGYMFTSKINGNSIFLPKAGRKFENSSYYVTESGYYWTSRLGKFFRDGVFDNNNYYCGYSIRPVHSDNKANDQQPDNPSSGLIDLGLSVRWRSCNLGATKPEEYGGYFQWAGTRDVSDTSLGLDWWMYGGYIGAPYVSQYNGDTDALYISKYNSYSHGKVDNRRVLTSEDDAASYHLGGGWRIPTYSEWNELINKCSWTYIVLNGIGGFKIQSNISGYTNNWIFLPCAGYRVVFSLSKYSCYYWASTLHNDLNAHALIDGHLSPYAGLRRYYGLPIRPVSD